MHTSNRAGGILVAGIAAAIVIAVVAWLTSNSAGSQKGDAGGGEQQTSYPKQWETGLASAEQAATFTVIVPDDALANPGNVAHVFLYPQGEAVVMEFPPPNASANNVSHEFIEVWEGPWTSGDPGANFREDIEQDHSASKAIYTVGGLPALGVSPRSSADQTNPAFVRMDVSGVDVEVGGGESLDDLLRVAKTIVDASSSSAQASSPAPQGSASS